MDRTLTITLPDTFYNRLEATLRRRSLSKVEQLIEEWLTKEEELRQRQGIIRQINALREQLFAMYGEMLDSIDLLRDDRTR